MDAIARHKLTSSREDHMRSFANAEVAAKFDAYPPNVRRKLLALRELVFRTAAATEGLGEIEETLKWGEPAYLTRNRSGSTVRMDWKKIRYRKTRWLCASPHRSPTT